MNEGKAIDIFAKEYPKLHIIKIVDLDPERFVVCAVENLEDKYSEIDPFYSIYKNSGRIVRFSPMEDLERFGKLMFDGD